MHRGDIARSSNPAALAPQCSGVIRADRRLSSEVATPATPLCIQLN